MQVLAIIPDKTITLNGKTLSVKSWGDADVKNVHAIRYDGKAREGFIERTIGESYAFTDEKMIAPFVALFKTAQDDVAVANAKLKADREAAQKAEDEAIEKERAERAKKREANLAKRKAEDDAKREALKAERERMRPYDEAMGLLQKTDHEVIKLMERALSEQKLLPNKFIKDREAAREFIKNFRAKEAK
jgi:hypothetical protein